MAALSQAELLARARATGERLRRDGAKHEKEFDSEHRLRMENLAFDIDVW